MTGKDLIEQLQKFPEADLEREIIIFDGPSYGTPSKFMVLGKEWGKRLSGKLMID